AVAFRLQVALELRDEQPAVGEDEDAERACGLDEARGCDRLPRRGRMSEPVAAHRSRIRPCPAGLRLVLLERIFRLLLGLLFFLLLFDRLLERNAVAVPVHVLLV